MKRFITFIASILAVGAIYATKPIAGHVVFIGLDGWAANTFDRAEMPFVKKLAAEGAF